jgi:hypothetical protein
VQVRQQLQREQQDKELLVELVFQVVLIIMAVVVVVEALQELPQLQVKLVEVEKEFLALYLEQRYFTAAEVEAVSIQMLVHLLLLVMAAVALVVLLV